MTQEEHRIFGKRVMTERTPQQRAAWVLRRACNGWRRDGQCRNPAGQVLPDPHPGCVRAQEEHDHILHMHEQT